ncbi:MAG: hypothetical protein RIF34_01095, partial [Candidatus Kapaibacterium sp.]
MASVVTTVTAEKLLNYLDTKNPNDVSGVEISKYYANKYAEVLNMANIDYEFSPKTFQFNISNCRIWSIKHATNFTNYFINELKEVSKVEFSGDFVGIRTDYGEFINIPIIDAFNLPHGQDALRQAADEYISIIRSRYEYFYSGFLESMEATNKSNNENSYLPPYFRDLVMRVQKIEI